MVFEIFLEDQKIINLVLSDQPSSNSVLKAQIQVPGQAAFVKLPQRGQVGLDPLMKEARDGFVLQKRQ